METLNSVVRFSPAAVVASEKSVLPLTIAIFLKMYNGALTASCMWKLIGIYVYAVLCLKDYRI
jgi:hypothetical protein